VSTLLLIDGHSLAYRAFYALPTDLVTSSGQVTNAVYGFTSMLVKVLGDLHPELVAVCFDTAAPTLRKERDETYKAGRKEMPDLFRSQLPLVREVLDTLAIPVLEVEGYEADDLIATLADRAAAQGLDVVVVTGDRDAFQVVADPHVRVLYNRRGVTDYVLYDEAGIEARTGVPPSRYLDYAALRGDPSDNLPGVPGVGEKTAAKLIATYGTLEELYRHLDELSPRQRERLEAARDQVFHNREMMRLRRDVPVEVDVERLRIGGFDPEALRQLFQQLEFRSLYPRLLEALGESATLDDGAAPMEVRVEVPGSAPEAAAAVAARARRGPVPLAAAWAGPPGRSAVAALALGTGDAEALVVPGRLLADPGVGEALARVAETGLVGHDVKALLHGLATVGVAGVRVVHDTAVMAYLLEPGAGRYPLDELARRHLGVELEGVAGPTDGTLELGLEATSPAAPAAAAAVVARLAPRLEQALRSRDLLPLYRDVELPLVEVLTRMEDAGIRVDRAFLEALARDLTDRLARLEAEIHALAGEPFVINSVPQLRRILFEVLGLTPVKKTKTGPSTDADSLQKMAAQEPHPILDALLRYREAEKLRSTYAEALPPLIGPDGRIHATFNQLATTTGRISSEHPNLQNIPVRTADGREMRRAFIAADGCGLLVADYSQIELRVLAHLAEDPGLIDAFRQSLDVHTITAARVFGVAPEEVDPFQRRFAKVVNYGLAYGMEAYGLAQRLDVPTDQAREILDAYFASFPKVREFMERTVAEARARGYTTTILGRRRPISELASDNVRIRQMGERMAQNAPVQGSAADIFKVSMVRLDSALRDAGLASRMVLTVHDELVLEVPEDERAEAERLTRTVMEHAVELRVPLVVEVGYGPTWADAK
jgi:DNA polymerase-1